MSVTMISIAAIVAVSAISITAVALRRDDDDEKER